MLSTSLRSAIHRLDVERVEREHRRDECASAIRGGHSDECEKQQEAVDHVQDETYRVVAARVHAEQLHVKLM